MFLVCIHKLCYKFKKQIMFKCLQACMKWDILISKSIYAFDVCANNTLSQTSIKSVNEACCHHTCFHHKCSMTEVTLFFSFICPLTFPPQTAGKTVDLICLVYFWRMYCCACSQNSPAFFLVRMVAVKKHLAILS